MAVSVVVVIGHRLLERHPRRTWLNSHGKVNSSSNLGSPVLVTRQGYSSSSKVDIFDTDIADNLAYFDINLIPITRLLPTIDTFDRSEPLE